MGIRKIKAVFTREMVEDLEKFHGLDIDADLEKSLVMELKRDGRKNSLNRVKEKIKLKNE
jgi:hypothetical protein